MISLHIIAVATNILIAFILEAFWKQFSKVERLRLRSEQISKDESFISTSSDTPTIVYKSKGDRKVPTFDYIFQTKKYVFTRNEKLEDLYVD